MDERERRPDESKKCPYCLKELSENEYHERIHCTDYLFTELRSLRANLKETVREIQSRIIVENDDPANVYFGLIDILRAHHLIEDN